MKNFKQRLAANPQLLTQGAPEVIRELRHLRFTGSDTNAITIPLCGAVDGVAKLKTRGVTCSTCRIISEALSAADNYDDAREVIAPHTPACIVPDVEVMKQRHGDLPTKAAAKHMEAANFLRNHVVNSPDDLYLRMIGTEAQFIWNLIELDLIDSEGDPNVPVWE